MSMSKIVLFICTANICRSPMAEALFNEYVRTNGNAEEWWAHSAGTWASENQAASALAVQVLAERGIALQGHRSHQVTRQDLEQADIVIAMTRNHRDALVSEFPEIKSKIHLMSELEKREYDIADPYGGVLDEYQIRARELGGLIERGFSRLHEWSRRGP